MREREGASIFSIIHDGIIYILVLLPVYSFKAACHVTAFSTQQDPSSEILSNHKKESMGSKKPRENKMVKREIEVERKIMNWYRKGQKLKSRRFSERGKWRK